MAVKNAPTIIVAVDTLNTRVTVPPAKDALTSRTGASTFESRVVQETGTH